MNDYFRQAKEVANGLIGLSEETTLTAASPKIEEVADESKG